MYSYLFRGVMLVDGSGTEPCISDVAVEGGRIVAIGSAVSGSAVKMVECDGLVLAPGFIDIHSHTDMTLFLHPLAESKVMQGVTTEVTGNCGLSFFPVEGGTETEISRYLKMHDFALPVEGITWHDLSGYADEVERSGTSVNIAPLVGHAPLRLASMGMDDRLPTAVELERMQSLLSEALGQGAWGMSTGLIYPPGSYAAAEELVALARTVAASGALYASHIRNEGEGLMTALEEAIAIAASSGGRVQVSHLKAMGGYNRGRGGEVLAKLQAARSAAIDVGADQYPYAASATALSAVVPQWAHAGGVAAMLVRLGDPELQVRLRGEIGREIARREGADGIMVSNCRSGSNRRLSGETLASVAAAWRCTAEEAVIRLILEEQGQVGAIFFSMAEEDVSVIMADPSVSIGSDGHALNADDASGEATHPRSYGTFPRVLARYVREKKLLSLTTAIRKMTGLPASRLGFIDRGLVRPGFAADIVLFDPATIADLSDYSDPHRYSTGVVHLLVNGQPVLWDGALTGERPGRVLRRVLGR